MPVYTWKIDGATVSILAGSLEKARDHGSKMLCKDSPETVLGLWRNNPKVRNSAMMIVREGEDEGSNSICNNCTSSYCH